MLQYYHLKILQSLIHTLLDILDTVQIQFGTCQKWKSQTIEVLLTFYYYNKTLYSCMTYTKLHVHVVNRMKKQKCKTNVER